MLMKIIVKQLMVTTNINTPISASCFMLPYWNSYASTGAVASINDGNFWLGTNVNPLEVPE